MTDQHVLDSGDTAGLRRRTPAAEAEATAHGEPDHPLLRLQSYVGNAQIARLLAQRDDAIPEDDEEDNPPIQAMHASLAQREVATPDDEEQDQSSVQAKHEVVGAEGGPVGPETASRIQAKRGRGAPLESWMLTKMENSLGARFGDVRVHTDSDADDFNRNLTAKAFTTGNDIFFRDGIYQPGSMEGRQILAHELTHVMQQRSMNAGGPMTVGAASDAHEQHADTVSAALGDNMQPEANASSMEPHLREIASTAPKMGTSRNSNQLRQVAESSRAQHIMAAASYSGTALPASPIPESIGHSSAQHSTQGCEPGPVQSGTRGRGAGAIPEQRAIQRQVSAPTPTVGPPPPPAVLNMEEMWSSIEGNVTEAIQATDPGFNDLRDVAKSDAAEDLARTMQKYAAESAKTDKFLANLDLPGTGAAIAVGAGGAAAGFTKGGAAGAVIGAVLGFGAANAVLKATIGTFRSRLSATNTILGSKQAVVKSHIDSAVITQFATNGDLRKKHREFILGLLHSKFRVDWESAPLADKSGSTVADKQAHWATRVVGMIAGLGGEVLGSLPGNPSPALAASKEVAEKEIEKAERELDAEIVSEFRAIRREAGALIGAGSGLVFGGVQGGVVGGVVGYLRGSA